MTESSLFTNLVNGHGAIIVGFLNIHLSELIGIFSEREGFEDIVEEMKAYEVLVHRNK